MDFYTDISKAIERFFKDEYGRIQIYPETNIIVKTLLEIFKQSDKLSNIDYVTLIKDGDRFSVEIHTSPCHTLKSQEEYVEMIAKSGIFIGKWKYIQYGPYFDNMADIILEDEEAKNGFIRLLKLYSI